MRTSKQLRCQKGRTSRVCVPRAQPGKKLGVQIGSLGLPLLVVQSARAGSPSLEDLKALSYESAINPKAAVQAAAEASDSALQLDAINAQDLMPLLAGLAVGIVVVGGAIAYFTKSSGPRIQV